MLPIGVQSFRKLREERRHYVDKTGYIGNLLERGTHYFPSRPRRFGKSLLVDTFRCLFECDRRLFRGLAIEPRWDWARPRPVVRLEFGRGNHAQPGYLQLNLAAQLGEIEEATGIQQVVDDGAERFAFVIRQLHQTTGRRVAVLVDEYDKPILDALHEPDIARANRDYLRGLYSVIKACDEHVHSCFLTGVTRFPKGGLFSGLNNLSDITLDPRYSSICGYSERDLDTVFAEELEGLDRRQVKQWYDGYSWGGDERVYNPVDVLVLLEERQFKNWWFATGTPTFLIDVLAEKEIPWHRIDGMPVTEEMLSRFDVGDIAAEALLFQAGYLTVLEKEDRGGTLRYRLGYPNREVRQSLNEALRDNLLDNGVEQEERLYKVLFEGDISGLEQHLRGLLAGIPYEWHGRNRMGGLESRYASVLYAHFAALGVEVQAQESSGHGRVDLCVRAYGRVYVFELKMRERAGPETALEQLKARDHADGDKGLGEPIHPVGVEFSVETRNVARFDAETV